MVTAAEFQELLASLLAVDEVAPRRTLVDDLGVVSLHESSLLALQFNVIEPTRPSGPITACS